MKLPLKGTFWAEYRLGGRYRAWAEEVPNSICLAAMTDILGVYFAGASAAANWYAGLIISPGTGVDIVEASVDPTDTAASHPGWHELTGYSESTRPQLPSRAAAGAVLTTGKASFTAAGELLLRGMFLATSNTKGGTGGLLFCTALFPQTRVLAAGGVLSLGYSLRLGGGED
jgi:hypothetical protein